MLRFVSISIDDKVKVLTMLCNSSTLADTIGLTKWLIDTKMNTENENYKNAFLNCYLIYENSNL